jgi:UV damage endonuclease UvdE
MKILIDSASFTYYRVCATISWASHAGVDPTLAIMERQYLSHLEKFSNIVGVPISSMFMIRDCPIDDIWRIKHYPDYKKSRRNRTGPNNIGTHIKHLNTVMASKFKSVIRIAEAEADDVIAMFVHLFPDEQFIIVSGDSDMHQLLSTRVRIFIPKGWHEVTVPESYEKKIISGDPADCIPASSCIVSNLRNRQLIDFTYIPRYIMDRVVSLMSAAPDIYGLTMTANILPRLAQLGLCCCNTVLRARDIFCSRTLILKTLETKGLDELKRRALLNCHDLIRMIKWNAENGIRVFRVSSDIFPHKSNPRAPPYTLDFARDLLIEAGRLARTFRQRITFHPGQYNVVGTPDPTYFSNTCNDLDWHAEVLDIMQLDQDSIIIVHGGGIYGNKDLTKDRWVSNFSLLSERVRRRLVLENCEKCFSVTDCLEISARINIPVIFDTHHHECYQLLHKTEVFDHIDQIIPKVLETWTRRSMKPKFHVSEQRVGSQIGAHSDFISKLPEYLLSITIPVDIMVEAKMKEQAVFKLHNLHPDVNTSVHTPLKLPVKLPSLPVKLPSLPSPPSLPVKLPTLPLLPSLPALPVKLPTLPLLPSLPALPVKLPTLPLLPSLPALPALPVKLPTLPSLSINMPVITVNTIS